MMKLLDLFITHSWGIKDHPSLETARFAFVQYSCQKYIFVKTKALLLVIFSPQNNF